MRHGVSWGLAVGATCVLLWAAGCSDGSGPSIEPPDEPEPPDPAVPTVGDLLVSDAISGAALASQSSDGTGALAASGPRLQAIPGMDLAYISLPEGSHPDGSTAVIGSSRLAGTVTVGILEGGFDPVPVAAIAGDEITVDVYLLGGERLRFLTPVPASRPPRVVRTVPGRDKTDVPFNTNLVVVFSEPMAGPTLASSVRLEDEGGAEVGGTVHLLEGTTTAAVFEPASPLDPRTTYRLQVTEDARDLGGESVQATEPVEFTTGEALVGSAHRVTVTPETTELAVGSQLQLATSAFDSTGGAAHGYPVQWVSEDPDVVSVSPAGLVTGLAQGEARVRAEIPSCCTATAVIIVSSSLTPAASLEIIPSDLEVVLGGRARLNAIARDEDGAILPYRPAIWQTNDLTVLDIGAGSGGTTVLRAVAPGRAMVTATMLDGPSASVPVDVVGAGYPYVSVTAGDQGTCGVTAGARALCWGWNFMGQLGSGTADDAQSAQLPTPIAGDIHFANVAAGALHGCGATTTGRAYCSGHNRYGELGIGTSSGPEACGSGTTPCSWWPISVTGDLTFVEVVPPRLSYARTCGITTDGAIYCWGAAGLLGIGVGPELCGGVPCSTRPVAVATELVFTAVDLGDRHICGLAVDGSAHCWGENQQGQLGDGTTTTRTTPVPVAGGLTFVAISTGMRHTCALTADGDAYCWGQNAAGQLGLGSTEGPEVCAGGSPCSTVPVLVTGAEAWSSISGGYEHTCARTTSDIAWCWGTNTNGQLGDGSEKSTASPVPVAGDLRFGNVSAGGRHSCGVTTSGIAYCWGENGRGELGSPGPSSNVPVRVSLQP